jgi:hypothetical protein
MFTDVHIPFNHIVCLQRQIIKEWNPDWSPKYFMCDYADEEINALGNVFPGILIMVTSPVIILLY